MPAYVKYKYQAYINGKHTLKSISNLLLASPTAMKDYRIK